MLKNNLLFAWRSVKRHKGYALINIAGFAIALCSAWMILLYVQNENTYDRFHPGSEDTYRVVADFKFNDMLDHLALSPPPLAGALKSDYPEVKQVTQLTQYNQGKTLVKSGEKKIYLDNIFFADSSFFNVLEGFRLIKGDARTALSEPNCVILTEGTAALFFGSEDPINKMLDFDLNDGTFAAYKVTGIVSDPPRNSHFRFNALTSMPGLWNIYPEQVKQDWIYAFMYTYIRLAPGTDHVAFQDKLKTLFARYNPEGSNPGVKASCNFIVEPLTSIHLESKRIWDVSVPGNSQYVKIFSWVALFLLIIAAINYINLATARASLRLKETGIRKVSGATRSQLIFQSMTESFVTGICAFIIAVILTASALGLVSSLTGIAFKVSDIFEPGILLKMTGVTFIVSLISGIYPGFYISRFQPVHILKSASGLSGRPGRVTLRKALVTFQFAISILLMIATTVVYRQLHYMMEKDPGFEKEHIVSVMLQDTVVASKFQALKGDLLKLPSVDGVSFAASIPGGAPDRKITRVEGKTPSELEEIPTQPVFMDFEFQELMGLKLSSGSFIKRDSGTGFRQAFLINEAAAEKFGWREPLGKRIVFGFNPQSMRDGKVIGVIGNFQTGSFKEKAEPMIFMVYTKPYAQTHIVIRVKPGSISAALKEIETVFSVFDPVHPFDPVLLDENIRKLYEAEIKMSRLFTVFSLLTLFIACLGLFGLSAFVTNQRIKEIGIRKVMGADSSDIVLLIAKDFSLLVACGMLIAFPAGWYLMQRWLTDFNTRIGIEWWIFLLSAVVTMLIALSTVSVQTLKAALSNPVKSLRYE